MDKGKLSSILLTVVPPISVMVVGLSLFFAGSPRPFQFARVFGGPTDATGPWTGRIQLLTRDGDVDEPLSRSSVRVAWADGGHSTEFLGETDEEGWVEARLERPRVESRLELAVYGGELGELMVSGAPQLSAERWSRAARRRSGILQSSKQGELSLAVRIVDGVLAVPFASQLSIEARNGEQPIRGAEITSTTEALDVVSSTPLLTNDQGRATLTVRPQEHVVALGLGLRAPSGVQMRWFSHLPVAAGAMRPRVDGDRLIIESPVARQSAWYTLVSPKARLAGGRIALEADGHGGAIGRIGLAEARVPAPPRDDLWLVVSGDADGRSPSTVGWPWGGQAATFDAVEALLLDGARFGAERELSRLRRVRWVVGAYALAALALTLFLFVTRVRRANSELVEQLEEAGLSEAAPSSRSLVWNLVVAGLCVLLGFLVVLLVSLFRAG